MTNDELKIKLEENNIPPELIDEILLNLKRDDAMTIPTDLPLEDRIFMLQSVLEKETDPRKRARIAARIISEKLD